MSRLNIVNNFGVISNTKSNSNSKSITTSDPTINSFGDKFNINGISFSRVSDDIKVPISCTEVTLNNNVSDTLNTYKDIGYEYCFKDNGNRYNFYNRMLGVSIRQEVYTSTGQHMFRLLNSDESTELNKYYTSIDPQLLVEEAVKLQTARKINITGVMFASAEFDGSKDITLNIDRIEGLTGVDGSIKLNGDTLNFGNTNNVYFGTSSDSGNTPSDYYFGTDASANIHVKDVIMNGTSITTSLDNITNKISTLASKEDTQLGKTLWFNKNEVNDADGYISMRLDSTSNNKYFEVYGNNIRLYSGEGITQSYDSLDITKLSHITFDGKSLVNSYYNITDDTTTTYEYYNQNNKDKIITDLKLDELYSNITHTHAFSDIEDAVGCMGSLDIDVDDTKVLKALGIGS